MTILKKICHRESTWLPLIETCLVALVMTLVHELLNLRSWTRTLQILYTSPLVFFINFLLLATLLSFAGFFKRRHLVLGLLTTLSFLLGLLNFVVLHYRITPVTFTDFKLIGSFITIIRRYFSLFEMVLAGLLLLGLIFVAYKGFTGSKKLKVKPLQQVIFTMVLSATLFLTLSLSTQAKVIPSHFGNLADAYQAYGFNYCFFMSLVDQGIKEPENYSEEAVTSVLETIASEASKPSEDKQAASPLPSKPSGQNKEPNIIFVQLESFFDVTRLASFTFDKDPIPNMRKAMQDYSGGFLTVPSIGAGTANSEFEVLTGMSLEFFGAGEYPYKSVLQDTTMESLATNLKAEGYHSQALHNNTATFYSRNQVYSQLGFDGFTSLEYMEDVTYNPIGWAEDACLIPEIIKTLQATDQKDFIFAVSVQAHGKYPEESIIDTPIIVPTVGGFVPPMKNLDQLVFEDMAEPPSPTEEEVLPESTFNKYLYYIDQLHETDIFIGDLMKALDASKEPYVLVLYGDHLPSLTILQEDLTEGSQFQVEYAIIDNIGLEKSHDALHAYQLGAAVLAKLGYNEGVLTKFHQTMQEDSDYHEELGLLQYDMLYGEKKALEGQTPLLPSPMKMGLLEISLLEVARKGEGLIVSGQGFTPFSEVLLNEEKVDALFLDNKTLILPWQDAYIDATLRVAQISETGKQLSATDSLVIGDFLTQP